MLIFPQCLGEDYLISVHVSDVERAIKRRKIKNLKKMYTYARFHPLLYVNFRSWFIDIAIGGANSPFSCHIPLQKKKKCQLFISE